MKERDIKSIKFREAVTNKKKQRKSPFNHFGRKHYVVWMQDFDREDDEYYLLQRLSYGAEIQIESQKKK